MYMKKNNKTYQICNKCIMDTSDPEIVFDESGVCNHCHRYESLLPSRVFTGETAELKLTKLIRKIKKSGAGKDYDCIIGVSGGVDSTYIAYLTKKYGLRPLAIHFDNNWNSELAVRNIEKTLNSLGIDLYTYVIDWDLFRDIQKAFLKSSTPDGEVPTDHAINALLFREASKRGIKYIINGMNFATESMAVSSWSYGHSDWRYIKYIYKKFGGAQSLKGYPHFSFMKLFYYTFIKKIKVISMLNYIEYNKDKVMNFIQKELGWEYYGGKHYESVYTRFFQGYYLPTKFGIDKRRGHLSDLIHCGQLTRKEALEQIKTHPYPSQNLLEEDKEFVLKKLSLTPQEFEDLIQLPNRSYRDYHNSENFVKILKIIVNKLRNNGLYTK